MAWKDPEKRKEYNVKNKEQIKEYNVKNKEQINKNHRKFYQKNKKKINEEIFNKKWIVELEQFRAFFKLIASKDKRIKYQKEYSEKTTTIERTKLWKNRPEYKKQQKEYQQRPERQLRKKEVQEKWKKKGGATLQTRIRFNAKLRAEVNKMLVYNHYSNFDIKCNCCGEREIVFLSLDHINNDGGKQRKNEAKENGYYIRGYDFYRQLVKTNFPPGFQLLCMNCNHGRARNKDKICPHKIKLANMILS